jgi:hypothetical protein
VYVGWFRLVPQEQAHLFQVADLAALPAGRNLSPRPLPKESDRRRAPVSQEEEPAPGSLSPVHPHYKSAKRTAQPPVTDGYQLAASEFHSGRVGSAKMRKAAGIKTDGLSR